jgi:hypothetical protein
MTDYLQPCRKDAQEACATEGLCCSGRCRQGRDCPHNVAVEPEAFEALMQDAEMAWVVVAVLISVLSAIVIGGSVVAHFYQGN